MVWRQLHYGGNSLAKGFLGLLLHIALIYISRSGALQSSQTLQPGRVFGSAQAVFSEILLFPFGIHLSAVRHDALL